MSLATSSLLRLLSTKGTSSSLVFIPKACSSSSARPVFRATSFTSGTCKSSFSASLPIWLLSSSEMPGSELMFMVNDPSLNGGKNERPSVKNTMSVIITNVAVEAKIHFDALPVAQSSHLA